MAVQLVDYPSFFFFLFAAFFSCLFSSHVIIYFCYFFLFFFVILCILFCLLLFFLLLQYLYTSIYYAARLNWISFFFCSYVHQITLNSIVFFSPSPTSYASIVSSKKGLLSFFFSYI